MNLLQAKAFINDRLNEYLGGVFRIRKHAERAANLQEFVYEAEKLRDLQFRIINEHSLFNLGYSLINVSDGNSFEHGINNINKEGKYYSIVISPIFEYLFSGEEDFQCFHPKESASNYKNTLIFRNSSDYTQDLISALVDLGIDYRQMIGNERWVRDGLIVGQDKVYVRTKTKPANIKKQQVNYHTERLKNYAQKYGQDECIQLPDTYLVTSKYLSNIQNIYDQDAFCAKEGGASRSLDGLIPKDSKQKETIRLLEGGNLFEAVNGQGIKYYFIGINALLNEVDLANLKNGAMSISNTVELTQREIFAQCYKELSRYKKIFSTDNVMILPQWSYHLDLQMSYVGKSTFLIHSFNEVVNKRWRVSRSCAQTNEFKDLANNAMERENIVRYISAIVNACGFNAIPYAGVLHKQRNVTDEHTYQQVKRKPIYATGNAMQSTFVNGIDVYSARKDRYYFLTIDSPNVLHKNYLIRLLGEQAITPIFLKANGKNPEQTVAEISREGGALRCQTNFVPNKTLV